MRGKRKRDRGSKEAAEFTKRQKVTGSLRGSEPRVKDALLSQYYPSVLSLREYLLSRLPKTSKIRRKKILGVGRRKSTKTGDSQDDTDDERVLADFLDRTLVGVSTYEISQEDRQEGWNTFSQRGDTSISTIGNLSSGGLFCQSDIVDFTIWLLFQKSPSMNGRLQHLLCQGYRKDVSSHSVRRDENFSTTIPGVNLTYPNSHVTSIKGWPWPQVLGLLGQAGERIMVDLILDCGIFLPIENASGSYHQLSGQPLSELRTLSVAETPGKANPACRREKDSEGQITQSRTASEIIFVRNRMLYGKAALNARGEVKSGLLHIHALNRYPYVKNTNQGNTDRESLHQETHPNTIRLMMYIFPRQFGLHNAFTSSVNPRETVQPFKDYTHREEEINTKYTIDEKVKLPKRLRGRAKSLVHKLQVLHSRCSYNKLLAYYCSTSKHQHDAVDDIQEGDISVSTVLETQSSKTSHESVIIPSSVASIPPRKLTLMDHATPAADVSAFVRAVLRNIIPHDFWGTQDVQSHNERVFHRNVDRFVRMRRFEVLSLHEVSQDIKIADIEWLRSPNTANQKMSQTDLNKCREIFLEFLYYLFDSIVLPLIRAHFHVTETNVHRQRLFFFRHDVWRSLAEPALASLKLKMFEEIKPDEAHKILDSRALGFSQIRLLPKETGVRPIMNLRRRVLQKKSKLLGSSINSVLGPIHSILTHEKITNPERLGSALFSVGDLYQKIKNFKNTLTTPTQPLYFAKVDVQAAFDTIPQSAVIKLMHSIPRESEYRIAKHVEIKPTDAHNSNLSTINKPIRRWKTLAKPLQHIDDFDEDLEHDLAVGKKHTIFIETVVNQIRSTPSLLDLLTEHISRNMVQIGKRFYRQKEGIPQGSVVSSLLCNYFYADLESKHLSFLQPSESLLLRLIDDFLLITTNPMHAKRFLEVMHAGVPEYGVAVNPEKTLTNFEVWVQGRKVRRLVAQRGFPYCGNFIDVKRLSISRDRERKRELDSLTVEYSRVPGKTFCRKVISSFHIQSHPMYLDTDHNSRQTVHNNLYTAFMETATKMLAYSRALPVGKRPRTGVLRRAVEGVLDVGVGVCLKGRGEGGGKTRGGGVGAEDEGNGGIGGGGNAGKDVGGFICSVLRRKRTGYGGVIEWLEGVRREEGLKGGRGTGINKKRRGRGRGSTEEGEAGSR
ncbi:Telomerase reverse transcriptase protein [Rutstroemia sp. NJR-2017a BBW]|nr:Telomerase reverse transcriptase protein [Rutstroemia sp. NJR-2017a BBW]